MYKLNRWYDRLGEPWRFLLFVLLVFPMIVIGAYGTSHGKTWAVLAGYLPMAVLILVRVWYHYLAKRPEPKPDPGCDERPTRLRMLQGGKR